MKTTILLYLMLLIFSAGAFAQSAEISTARTNIKNKTNLDKAEKSMRMLLADSSNRSDMRIYRTLRDAAFTRYDTLNTRLYERLTVDSTELFTLCENMFRTALTWDSAAVINNKLSKRQRSKWSNRLAFFAPNLLSGGQYFYRKEKYKEAYKICELHINLNTEPLFSMIPDSILPDSASIAASAYISAASGWHLNSQDSTMKHANIALNHDATRRYTMQIIAMSYICSGDTVKYAKTIKNGCVEFPTDSFFFKRRIMYCRQNGDLAGISNAVSRALTIRPNDIMFLKEKADLMLDSGYYRGCIALCDTLINRGDSLPELYWTAGAAYMNLAFDIRKLRRKDSTAIADIKSYYEKAAVYIEKYKDKRPADSNRWTPMLYTIYLHLNRGDDFDRICGIMENTAASK